MARHRICLAIPTWLPGNRIGLQQADAGQPVFGHLMYCFMLHLYLSDQLQDDIGRQFALQRFENIGDLWRLREHIVEDDRRRIIDREDILRVFEDHEVVGDDAGVRGVAHIQVGIAMLNLLIGQFGVFLHDILEGHIIPMLHRLHCRCQTIRRGRNGELTVVGCQVIQRAEAVTLRL